MSRVLDDGPDDRVNTADPAPHATADVTAKVNPPARLRRLDVAVVEEGLAETRARAQSLILGGGVLIDGKQTMKPSSPVPTLAHISLVREPLPYVSRGGLKLAAAIDHFGVTVQDKVALDVGASTGGFTDVLLLRGATRVYAVDVGYGQLAWRLRNDPRVVVMERTNIRYVDSLPERPALVVADVSFISLRLVLPAVEKLVDGSAEALLLVKPQFEAGKGRVGKRGVVRDPAVWRDVLQVVLRFATERGWSLRGIMPSPITGPAGNVEFLAHLSWSAGDDGCEFDASIEQAVSAARRPPVAVDEPG